MNEINAVSLHLLYGYHGANCSTIKIKESEDSGCVQAFNDFGEKVFHGGTREPIVFLSDLENGRRS